MKLVPLGDKVVVRRLQEEGTTPGGIVLPEAAREKPRQGRVLSVGDGRRLPGGARVALAVNDGDRVLFNSYAGAEVNIEGHEDILIMSEDEILAVVEGA